MKSLQIKRPTVIRIRRTVYSEEELEEIKCYAERGGAQIISETPVQHGQMVSVILELDRKKRQF